MDELGPVIMRMIDVACEQKVGRLTKYGTLHQKNRTRCQATNDHWPLY